MVAAPPQRADFTLTQKLVRYGAVSAIATPLGLGLLTLFFNVFGWSEVWSNIFAVCLSAIPSYLLNRSWVWQKDGVISWRYEVFPFWLMAVMGLVLSTALVGYVGANFDFPGAVQLANLGGFGVIWVLKFFVLERYLFANPDNDSL